MIHLLSAAGQAALLSLGLALMAPCQALAYTSDYGPGQTLEEAQNAEAQRIGREQARLESPEYQAFLDEAARTLPVLSFDVNRFTLPGEAGVLVVVEGTGGSLCDVYVYEKTDQGWQQKLTAAGHLGMNGLNSHRTVGDKTTPIGVFQLNTPFGQAAPKKGFPKEYIQVNSSYVWSDASNRLVQDDREVQEAGEKVGTLPYIDYYDYVLDMGFNPQAIPNQGSALFLHCEGDYWLSTSGCVAIPRDAMETIMKLYGTWGAGHCFIALAPEGSFDSIYDTFGTNRGLSPGHDPLAAENSGKGI